MQKTPPNRSSKKCGTGTVRANGLPQAVTVLLYHLGGVSPAQRLAETSSNADGRYDVSAEVEPRLCDAFFVAADLRPIGGEIPQGKVFYGCGQHTSDIEGG